MHDLATIKALNRIAVEQGEREVLRIVNRGGINIDYNRKHLKEKTEGRVKPCNKKRK